MVMRGAPGVSTRTLRVHGASGLVSVMVVIVLRAMPGYYQRRCDSDRAVGQAVIVSPDIVYHTRATLGVW